MKEYAGTRKRQPATPPTARRALRRKDWPPRRSGRHCGLSDGPGVSGGQGCERATSIHPVLFRRRRRAVGRGTGNTVCARWAAASGPLGPGLRDFAPRSFDRLTGRKQAPQNKKAGISWALEASAAPAVPGRQTGSRPPLPRPAASRSGGCTCQSRWVPEIILVQWKRCQHLPRLIRELMIR